MARERRLGAGRGSASPTHVHLGLAGVDLPLSSRAPKVYAKLVAMHQDDGLDFCTSTTFNLDEHVSLSSDDRCSYRSYMNAHLFAHVDVTADNTHLPDGTADDLKAEASRELQGPGFYRWMFEMSPNGSPFAERVF